MKQQFNLTAVFALAFAIASSTKEEVDASKAKAAAPLQASTQSIVMKASGQSTQIVIVKRTSDRG